MGVLPHTHILDAIINTDGNSVALSRPNVFRDVIAMGCGERHLVPHFLPVHEYRRLNVRTLQKQNDVLAFPGFRYIDALLVPSLTHIIRRWCQEEWELDIPLHTVLLHIGVEIERRVIERSCPTGINRHGISLAVGLHGARQEYIIIVLHGVTYGKRPLTSQANRLLGRY